MPEPFLKDAPTSEPRTPGVNVTGPVPVKPLRETVPYEQLVPKAGAPQAPAPSIQLLPVFAPQPPTEQNPLTPQTPPPATEPAPAVPRGEGNR
jgi:hypothetical protein